MATFDSRDIVNDIIRRNGDPSPGDPPGTTVTKIVEYTNLEGHVCWGAVFAAEERIPHMWSRYEVETPYVRQPRVIWIRAASSPHPPAPTPTQVQLVLDWLDLLRANALQVENPELAGNCEYAIALIRALAAGTRHH